jgi:hypothetical protein
VAGLGLSNQTSLWIVRLALAVAIFLCGWWGAPWWALALPAFGAGFYFTAPGRGFCQAFAIAFAVWALAALAQDLHSGFRLSGRIAGIFGLPLGLIAYAATGVIAGLVAGLAAWCGQNLRAILLRPRPTV